eukprot:GSChrysophyteH1.ASY1.ANO1.3185.1 assembled CDS
MSSQTELKRQVGYQAVDEYVRSGMTVGLGTGSTAYFAVERVGQLLKSGDLEDIVCIPTSEATRAQAEGLGIPLSTLDERGQLDVSIDGADDVDPNLCLIKGGGGALLREKMVESVSKKFVCIVDESKLSPGLGPKFPLPVEITPFCHEHTRKLVDSNNKKDGDDIAVTDNGNYIVDLHFEEPIRDVALAAQELKNTVGVVEHGLFAGMACAVIVAGTDGVRVAGENGENPWWGA